MSLGFFRRRREREALQERASVSSILAEIERGRLERVKLENELEIQRLTATREEREEERAYQRKVREQRVKHAAEMRAIRAEKRQRPAQHGSGSGDCKLCVNPMATNITIDDIAMHRQHEGLRQ